MSLASWRPVAELVVSQFDKENHVCNNCMELNQSCFALWEAVWDVLADHLQIMSTTIVVYYIVVYHCYDSFVTRCYWQSWLIAFVICHYYVITIIIIITLFMLLIWLLHDYFGIYYFSPAIHHITIISMNNVKWNIVFSFPADGSIMTMSLLWFFHD